MSNQEIATEKESAVGKAIDRRLLKRLLRFGMPYKKMMVSSILVLLTAQGVSAFRPKIVQMAIDSAIIPRDFSALNFYAILFLGLLFVEFLFQYGVIYITQLMGQKIVYDIRTRLFRHIQGLHIQFFDRNPVGRLITRVTSDIDALNEMFTSGIVYIFGDIFLLLGIVAFMFLLSPQLTLVALAVLPLIFLISSVFKRKVRKIYRQVRHRISALNSYLQENISGAFTVQLFNRQRKNFEIFEKFNTALKQSHIKSIAHYAWFYPAINVCTAVAMGGLLWFGGSSYLKQYITLGTLIAFIQYTLLFFRPIQDLSDKYNILQTAMASSERIFHLFDTRQEIVTDAAAAALEKVSGRIAFENVFFAYYPEQVHTEDDYILKDISFEIEPGQSIAVVGHTGAGKTSVINLLLRFYNLNAGRILIDGVDLTHIDPVALRKHVAIVLQDVFLFSGTVMDNIRLGNTGISEQEARDAAVYVGADKFIQQLDAKYDEQIQERGSNLSAGQRQLISFARALAYKPEILVLDEATSNIDTETEEVIQAAIKKLLKGRTSIVIAHRLSTIRNVDQIIVLHKGRIHEKGTHEDLLEKKGLYHRLYQLQYAEQERNNHLEKSA